VEASIGKQGSAFMEALGKALIVGGQKNIDALADTAVGFKEVILRHLDPAEAGEATQAFMNAIQQSIDEGTAEPAFAVVHDILTRVKEAGTLTAQTFVDSFDGLLLQGKSGESGSTLVDNIAKAAQARTPEAVKAVGRTAANFSRELFKDLKPDQAQSLFSDLMREIARTIDDQSPESVRSFATFIGDLNQQAQNLRLDNTIKEIV